MKHHKVMIDGKYVKVNGRYIYGNGYFAYDGCHKIYILEDEKDVTDSMEYCYRLYPDTELKDVYEKSCPLRFISNWKLTKNYVKQDCIADWSEVTAPKKEIFNDLADELKRTIGHQKKGK